MKGNGLIVMLFIILATIFLNIDGINGKVDHIELKVSIKSLESTCVVTAATIDDDDK